MGLEPLKPLIALLPEIRTPTRAPPLKEKIFWTVSAILIFFVMYHVYPIGRYKISSPQLEFTQVITASRVGSLITVGIGPIVLGSIFLQLFIGAKILDIDLQDPKQKALFTGTQKLLGVLLAFVESAIYVFTNAVPVIGVAGTATTPLLGSVFLTQLFVIFQLAMGAMILLYMDETVSKYGIGSGISLFIAAGVSLAVVQGVFSVLVPRSLDALNQGGADAIPRAVLAFLPLLFTLIVFVVTAYADGVKVEIPLAFERVRGVGGRFPIKLLYVSNIPVILASALLLNLQLLSRVITSYTFYIGNVNVIDLIAVVDAKQNGRLIDGFLYFISPNFFNPLYLGDYGVYLQTLMGRTPLTNIPELAHVFVYIISYVVLCVVFGRFWIETTGMSAKDVAEQLKDSGLLIPGFRRDPRIIEKILDKYIPMITILGSIFVGLLASFADLTGALGTGTGILLTVGILGSLYETLEREKMFELYPELKKIVS
jgi:preprotein translocase subunit SecY